MERFQIIELFRRNNTGYMIMTKKNPNIEFSRMLEPITTETYPTDSLHNAVEELQRPRPSLKEERALRQL